MSDASGAGASIAGHLVLVGLMGAGKSAVGRRVAAVLGRRFVDLDEEIERRESCSVPDIFAGLGEQAFRDREQWALADLLELREPLVIATGGGTVLRWSNREAMREHGTVVWLRANADTLIERVGDGEGRPLLAGDAAATIERLVEERRKLYAAAGHHVVDVDLLTPEEATQAVIGAARSDAVLEADGE